MKTDDLIGLLVADGRAVDPAAVARGFHARLGLGVALAVAAMLLVLGPRPDLAAAATLPMFWAKLALPAAVGLAAWGLVRRLGHPGMRLGRVPAAALAPVALVWAAGALVLWQAAPGQRLALLLGQTWAQCPATIALLSLPPLAAAVLALRRLAPTRPTLAGAAAGLFAGAAGAFAYAFHGPELQAPFLAVWYVAGMLIPAAAGALLGRRWLHW
jgi:hypothetical protein